MLQETVATPTHENKINCVVPELMPQETVAALTARNAARDRCGTAETKKQTRTHYILMIRGLISVALFG